MEQTTRNRSQGERDPDEFCVRHSAGPSPPEAHRCSGRPVLVRPHGSADCTDS